MDLRLHMKSEKQDILAQVIAHSFYAQKKIFKKFFKFVGENTRAVCFSTVFTGGQNPCVSHSLYFNAGRQKKLNNGYKNVIPILK